MSLAVCLKKKIKDSFLSQVILFRGKLDEIKTAKITSQDSCGKREKTHVSNDTLSSSKPASHGELGIWWPHWGGPVPPLLLGPWPCSPPQHSASMPMCDRCFVQITLCIPESHYPPQPQHRDTGTPLWKWTQTLTHVFTNQKTMRCSRDCFPLSILWL